MSAQPKDSDAVAELLRESPPALDELTEARMERAILARERSAPRAPSRRPMVMGVVGGALAVAAAVALFFVLRSPAPEAPVARFEVRELDATGQRGTLEAGSVLVTGPNEVADIRVADSEVRLDPSSRLRIATMTADHLALELSEGGVRVGFHPRERGREHLEVTTPEARVEVVGTVFRVERRGEETRVSVSEGIVRVVPLGGGAPRAVRAGESTRVPSAVAEATDRPEARLAPEADVEAIATEGAPEPTEPSPSEPRAASPSPRALLAAAQRALREGRADRAEPMLRRVAEGAGPAAVRARAWALLGDLSQRSGRLDQAVTAYERAATLGRGTMAGPNAIYSLARLQERRLGDAAAARRSYDRYLDAAPEGPLADQARAALCRLGDAERCP